MNAQPPETDCVRDDRLHNQYIGSPIAKVGKAADGQKEDNLGSERDAPAEKHDAVDGAGFAGEG